MKVETRDLINKLWNAVTMLCQEVDRKALAAWVSATTWEEENEREHRADALHRMFKAPRNFSVETAGRYFALKWFTEALAKEQMSPHPPRRTMPVADIVTCRLGEVLARACALYLLELPSGLHRLKGIDRTDIEQFSKIDYQVEMETAPKGQVPS